MPKQRSFFVALAGALCVGGSVMAQDDGAGGRDWPQWRGPARTGISAETSWGSEGKAEPLWAKELGFGHSSFSISDGRVYTLGYDLEAKLDRVFCFDAETGEELWRHKYPSEYWTDYHDGGTQTTPTVIGDVVYTSNREGKLFCLDAGSGDVRWSHDLRAQYGLEPPTWGFSASPLIVDDRIYMNLGRVIAFDRVSGDEVWITDENRGIAYSTPAAFDLDGGGYLASLTGDGLGVIDRTNGREIDFYPWSKRPNISPMTPVVVGERIFISAGYDHGCVMLKFSGGKLEEQWANRKMRNKMTGCVLFGDHLYGFDESILKCMDLDGNEKWRKRGLGTGSMSIAGGRMVIADGKGQVIIAEANPEEYVELSRQKILSGGTYWSSPVLSHGRVYVRNSLGQMACLDFAGSDATSSQHTAADGALPSADVIVARHNQAVGGTDAAKRISSIVMTGPGESLRNTVRKETVNVSWNADAGFRWSDKSGFNFGHNGDHGWIVGSGSPPVVLESDGLHAIREAGDFKRLFDIGAGYESMTTISREAFDNRDCFAVEAKTGDGFVRTLYFEVESGLYAGLQGEGIHMWTLGDYRDCEGVMLPTQWALYEPVQGEMDTATFDDIKVNASIEPAHFSTPTTIVMLTRTPAQVESDNARLKSRHTDLLGQWVADGAPAGAPPMVFDVADGFLRLSRPGNEPDNLIQPDESDHLVILGLEYVRFTPQRTDDGTIESIQITVAGEPRGQLKRVAGGG